jgi:threonylcarbamoyladenosine tRNA methylthiotransferase MtaB
VPTAAFATLGCKVNQYETQRILDDFEERGFTITEFNVPADVYVINTCSVTQAAERKSRSMVRRLARQNPEAVVVMTGCYGEMAQIKGETVEEATLLVPNHQKLDTLKHVLAAYPLLERKLSDRVVPEKPIAVARRTRATIKVQDGCNVYCSFCSIPYTRKVMLSRPIEELIAEAEKRVSQGYKELVVTGVLVGAYGQDGFMPVPSGQITLIPSPGKREEGSGKREGMSPSHPLTSSNSGADGAAPSRAVTSSPHHLITPSPDLADCLLRLAQVPGIQRVRLSSIEPTQVTDRLLDAFAQEPKLCRHLHIPLQSGDSGVLRAMNRPYDREFYLDRCREAYRRIPDLAITSDIMVGFPGEDAAAFENTLDVVRTVGFARAHLFRYSPRPNTPAANFPDQVADQEKEVRSKALNAVCRETQQRFIQRFIGRTLEVLVEGKEGPNAESGSSSPPAESGQSETGNDHHERVENEPEQSSNIGGLLGGYTSNYIRVQFTGGSHLVGTVAGVRLVELSTAGALGEVGGAHYGPFEAPPDADFIPLASFAGSVT